MPSKRLRLVICGLLVCSVAISSYLLRSEARPVYAGFTVHEWGTFTSIAGNDGQAVEWSPLTGSTDLPGFVEHFRTAGFKLGLRGTVRMETPVLYFYDTHEETVSVKVAFSKGLITEWYPHASRVEPAASLFDGSLYQKKPDGTIAWDAVTLMPNQRMELPREARENHYYAARMTSSTPLRVKTPAGDQLEKFLFYRGVAAFSVPISAKLTAGDKLTIVNHGVEEIPNTIMFERHGERMGYLVGGAVQKETSLDSLALTGTIEDLGRELEGMLVAQGLYQDEAHAMAETWRSSWFEEGSRLLYIVPAEFVNTVLPLSISPTPSRTVRVFVGRLEIVTPATETAVEQAIATKDNAALQKYSRFLEPILQTMIKKERNPTRAKKFNDNLSSFYSAQIVQNQRRN